MRKTLLYGLMGLVTLGLTACHSHSHDGEDAAHAEEAQHDHDHEKKDAHADEDADHADEAKAATDEIVLQPAQAKAAGVQVQTLQPSTLTEVIEVGGQVLPAPGAEATVTATMAGIVRLVAPQLTEGSTVTAGQQLFVVNAQSVADGNPAAAAQAELQAAKQALERLQRLAKDRLATQAELEAAQQRYATAQSTAQSLGSGSQVRGMAAPIGGFVKSLLVRNGDYVAAGQALAVVAQSRRVQLRADVPERYYDRLAQITSANFRTAYDAPNRVHTLAQLGGRLLTRGQAAADGGYFVPVTFEFNNTSGIVTGSRAEVYLLGKPRAGVLAVPTEALVEAQGIYYVFLQLDEEGYKKQEVRIGASDGARVELLSGVKAGDKVVVKGAVQVRLAANSTSIPHGHQH